MVTYLSRNGGKGNPPGYARGRPTGSRHEHPSAPAATLSYGRRRDPRPVSRPAPPTRSLQTLRLRRGGVHQATS
jgi:hypothetical protein